ncbi:MAG: hypothetical protein FJ042_06390 [Candidatus Cloacimonetes bacterium]|nr:hypothetical protein [Candidatus Cloacimonadota bacterium]
MNRALILLPIALLVLGACSSLPKRPIPQAKQNADLLLQQAQRLEINRRLIDSIDGYESALRSYELIDEMEGQLICHLGIARAQLQMGFPDDFNQTRQNLVTLIGYSTRDYSYYLRILDLHRLYQQQDWQGIRRIGENDRSYPEIAQIQILSYRLQADARLMQVNPDAVTRLTRLTQLNYQRLQKNRAINPEIVSTGYYTLAYYYLVHGRHDRAAKYIAKAKEIDFDYEIYLNLGFDLWLEAQIARVEGNTKAISGLLIRARKIFQNYRESGMLRSIDKELAALAKE